MITYKLPNCDVEVLIDKGSPSYVNENELHLVSDYSKMSIVMKSTPWHWKIQGKLIPITKNLLASDEATDLVKYVEKQQQMQKYWEAEAKFLREQVCLLAQANAGLRKEVAQLKEENGRLSPDVSFIWKEKINLDEEMAGLTEGTEKKTVLWAENGDGFCRCLSCNQSFTGDVLAHDCQKYGKAWTDEDKSVFHASPSKLEMGQPNSPEKQETWRDRSPLL